MSAEAARKPLPEMRPPLPTIMPDVVCGRCWGPIVWFSIIGRRGCASWVCELRAFQSAQTITPKGADVPEHHAHPRQGQRCSACNAEFVFYPHERTGRPAPLIEAADGNIAVNDDGTYRIIKKGEAFAGPRYLNHFANCSAASTFHRDDRRHGR